MELDDFAEVAHLEVAARCQLACSYCYARDRPATELSTSQWKAIISDLASYGVFQITFGGGEPTLREDLKERALHAQARRKGRRGDQVAGRDGRQTACPTSR